MRLDILPLQKGGEMNNQYRSKHDIHPLDPYIKWLANRKIMLSTWVITNLVGMWLSHHFNQWSLLPRFGCIGIMIGTLLTLSPLFSDGIYLSNAEAFGFGGVDEDGKTAVRANGAALGQDDSEWTFAQFANIMLAMKTAKNEITKLSGESYLSQIDAKEYFKNILDHQILTSFEKGAPPDAAYKPLGSIQSAMKIEPLWNENREFFCT